MKFAEMLNAVLVRAKGCPESEALDAMRNAAIEFCEETYCLSTGNSITVDGTEVPSEDMTTRVIDIIEVRVADEPVLVTYMNDPAVDELEDGKYALTYSDPNFVELIPAPTVAAPVTLDMLIVIGPGPDATEVPDLLWRNHGEALRHGALAALLGEPGKGWSNPTLASFHSGRFTAAMRDAAAANGLNRRNTAARIRVTPV